MKRMRIAFFILCAFFAALAPAYAQTDLQAVYDYLNRIRTEGGMTPFSRDPLLEASAANHAAYLATNGVFGHNEVSGAPGFTGQGPSDRAVFAGYRSRVVSENLSLSSDYLSSVDNLMGAIYHRFGFLDFHRDEVGIGAALFGGGGAGSLCYAYNMGSSLIDGMCGEGISAPSGYRGVCSPDIVLDAARYDQAWETLAAANPELVVWPPDGGLDSLPVFFEEIPDPLPDYAVSGNPVSVQFNPLYYGAVTVTAFRLFKDDDNTEILTTRLLTQGSDPNANLDGLQYALFPLERLAWNTGYRAVVQYQAAGVDRVRMWRFRTRDLGIFTHTPRANGEIIAVPSGSRLAVYLPPASGQDVAGGFSYSFSGGMSVSPQFVDSNTLLISTWGENGNEAAFTLDNGRTFIIRISPGVPLPCETITLRAGLDLTTLVLTVPGLEVALPDGTREVFFVKMAYNPGSNPISFTLTEIRHLGPSASVLYGPCGLRRIAPLLDAAVGTVRLQPVDVYDSPYTRFPFEVVLRVRASGQSLLFDLEDARPSS